MMFSWVRDQSRNFIPSCFALTIIGGSWRFALSTRNPFETVHLAIPAWNSTKKDLWQEFWIHLAALENGGKKIVLANEARVKKKFVSSFSFALDHVDLQGPNYFLQEWELRASYNWMENQSASKINKGLSMFRPRKEKVFRCPWMVIDVVVVVVLDVVISKPR